jgi:hypothetical protein
MPDYRCYPIMSSGSIDGPVQIINSRDDASAIAKAQEMFRERPFEVWLGARKIGTAGRGDGGPVRRKML